MRFVLTALAVALCGSAADAQCVFGNRPIRSFFQKRLHGASAHTTSTYSHQSVTVASGHAAPVVVPQPMPTAAQLAAPALQATGLRDRLRDRLWSEITQLQERDRTIGLNPDQWARLIALIELFLRLFGGLK